MIVTFWTMNRMKTLVLLLMDVYLKIYLCLRSLSVAADGYVNLPGYSELALSMHAGFPERMTISWRGGSASE